MTDQEVRDWQAAGRVAEIAMGTYVVGRGRGSKRKHATDDPLAWWCLTELLYYGIARKE